MSRPILVPLDGSDFSESALPVALAIARRWNAPLEVLTVHDAVPSLDHDLWEVASREWTERYIVAVADRIEEESGIGVKATALSGGVAEAIQSHVEACDGALVVMATHGRGPLSRFWLGSTADSLVRHSNFPILLLRPTDDAKLDPSATYSPRNVLIPLDGSSEAESIMERAFVLADDPETTFNLLRVFPYPEEFASTYLPHTIQVSAGVLKEGEEAARTYVEVQAAALRARGIKATGHVSVDANPASGILHFAENSGADLIAMSTHGRGGVSRVLLGSVTDKVLRGAEVPMLVYRPEEGE